VNEKRKLDRFALQPPAVSLAQIEKIFLHHRRSTTHSQVVQRWCDC